MSNHVQTFLNLLTGDFDWSEGGVATLKIVQNERLMKFKGKKKIKIMT